MVQKYIKLFKTVSFLPIITIVHFFTKKRLNHLIRNFIHTLFFALLWSHFIDL